MRILAAKHIEARFIKIDAEKAPFICSRLNVYMMPTILLMKDGFTEDRVEGFDELGGTTDFTTKTMELRLAVCGVIDPPKGYGLDDRAGNKFKGKTTYNKNNRYGKSVYQSNNSNNRVVDEINDDEFDDLSDFSD